MGLFGRDPVVDSDIREVLLTVDRGSLKAAEKLQPTLRRLARPGEKIEFVAMGVKDAAIAVVGTRVYLFEAGPRILHEIPLTNIQAVSQTPSRMNTTFLEGALDLNTVPRSQWPWSTFASEQIAHDVCVRINRMILSVRPRSIPTLKPSYYEDILVKAGKPVTPEWLNDVAFWIGFVISGRIAATLGTNPNPRLFNEFVRKFTPVVEGEDYLDFADDVIDWAWRSHPVLHRWLVEKVEKHRGNTEIRAVKQDRPSSRAEKREWCDLWKAGVTYTFNNQKLYAYMPI